MTTVQPGHAGPGDGRRWQWTLDAVPVAGSLARTSVMMTQRHRIRRVEVPHPPGLGLLRPNALGWSVRIRLREGQVPAGYVNAAEQLAHAWWVHAARVTSSSPGRVWLLATRKDPLTTVRVPAAAGELLRVVGMLETGQPWVIDFRVVPHWFNAGATQSGKSNLANAIIKGLAQLRPPRRPLPRPGRPDADLPRTRRTEHLPAPRAGPPVPVVVLVDEVAELFLMADKSEKDQVSRMATGLLRVAQLGRAFGIYLIVCGQRIGADLGPGVTALRAQLSGRICHRVNDPETATMTLGDLDPAALDAARAIPANTPGVAIVAGLDGTWHRARSALVTEDDAEHAGERGGGCPVLGGRGGTHAAAVARAGHPQCGGSGPGCRPPSGGSPSAIPHPFTVELLAVLRLPWVMLAPPLRCGLGPEGPARRGAPLKR